MHYELEAVTCALLGVLDVLCLCGEYLRHISSTCFEL
jgi:hypothetical protein